MKSGRSSVRLAAICIALVPALTAAQSFTTQVPLNPEAATDDAGDDEGGVNVVAAPNGTWIATWHSKPGFVRARSSDDGRTWSVPSTLLPWPPGGVPKLATDGDGGWVAAWYHQCPGACTDEMWVSHSTDDGVTWSEPYRISDVLGPGINYQDRPSITIDASGAFFVTWTAYPQPVGPPPYPSPYAVLARSSDRGASWTVTTPFPSGSYHPEVAAGGATVLAAWDGGSDGIYYARSTDGGSTWNAAVTLYEHEAPGLSRYPVVATDRQGTWIITWVRGRYLPSISDYARLEADLLFVRSEDDGLTWSEPLWLNTTAEHDGSDTGDHLPHVVVNEHGVWGAVWEASGDVVVAWSYDGGRIWTPPQAISRTSIDDSGPDGAPDLAAGASGAWVAVWSARGLHGADFDAYFARAGCGCAPCDVCDAQGACASTPRSDCSSLGLTDTARLLIEDAAGRARDRLVWKLRLDASQTVPPLADPLGSTVGLCMYGSDQSLTFRGTAPAGRACGDQTCWSRRGTGFAYQRSNGAPDGIVSAAVRSAHGATRLTVVAQGRRLTVPSLPLTTPVVTQLQAGDACWEVPFTDAGAVANRGHRFVGRATGVP